MPGAQQVIGIVRSLSLSPHLCPLFPAYGCHHMPRGSISQEKVALITWNVVLSIEFRAIPGTQCPEGAGAGRAQAP